MKVSLLQRDIVWGDPVRNTELIESEIDKCQGSDLYVLPEMFSTGFITDDIDKAEVCPGVSLPWMKKVASKYDCAIAGSVAINVGDKNFNRFFFVKPDGTVVEYDKKHLFSYGNEPDKFTAGDRRVVVEWRGVRFLLLVCYDLRFPVWSRNRGDYDAIICVANWPAVRSLAWNTLVVARAIENQSYMLAVNRAGTDSVGDYEGGTALINPYGEIIARCRDYTQDTVTGVIDMQMLEAFRAKFPVKADADDFEIL